MMWILILGGIILLFTLWAVGSYNRFVQLKAMLQEAWSGIDVQLKRRYDLIPNLVETVKGYAGHEKSVFENVTKFRAQAMSAEGIKEKEKAENQLTNALKTLFAVAENYPQLKANENFIALQSELSKIENDIQLSRRYYNGTARNYNIGVQTFPSNIVASLFGFKPAPYFELGSEAERKAPDVKF